VFQSAKISPMIDHSNGNLRIFEHIEFARVLSQLYAANEVERAKNNARWNLSRNDKRFIAAVVDGFDEKSVFLDSVQS